MVGNAHADVAIFEARGAFGVEGNQIERRAGFSGGVIRAAEAVLNEVLEPARVAAGYFRAADARLGQGTAHGVGRIVVELVKFVGSALPIGDVGFVPDFPEPGSGLGLAIFFSTMLGPLEDQLAPLGVVFGRVSPAGGTGSRNPG